MRKLLLVVLTLGIVSCGGSPGAGEVTLTEFAIDTGGVAAGGDTLTVTNDGQFSHTLLITEEDGTVVAATEVLRPGDASTLTVDLAPGVYRFTCRIVIETGDGRIVDHYEEGMVADVTATATS